METEFSLLNGFDDLEGYATTLDTSRGASLGRTGSYQEESSEISRSGDSGDVDGGIGGFQDTETGLEGSQLQDTGLQFSAVKYKKVEEWDEEVT